jgi:hypothetical protein
MSRYGGLTSYRGYHQLKILFIAKQIIFFVLFTNYTKFAQLQYPDLSALLFHLSGAPLLEGFLQD